MAVAALESEQVTAPNVRTATVWVPLGYSPFYPTIPLSASNSQIQELIGVVGEFCSVRFQVLRFGEQFFEVSMTRIAKSKRQPDRVDVVAGKIGDTMLLSTGETLSVMNMTDQNLVKLHFKANE